jgi:hypothetical protein
MRKGGVERVWTGSAGQHRSRRAQVRRNIGVRNERCGHGSKSDQELWAEVCAEATDKACCCCEGDLLFDVEIKTVELVDGDDGV